jgi:CHAD domain-containing protein
MAPLRDTLVALDAARALRDHLDTFDPSFAANAAYAKAQRAYGGAYDTARTAAHDLRMAAFAFYEDMTTETYDHLVAAVQAAQEEL